MAPETHIETATGTHKRVLLSDPDETVPGAIDEQQRGGEGKFDALLALAGTGKGIWNEDAVQYQRRLRGSL